jgi:hypothetical protein
MSIPYWIESLVFSFRDSIVGRVGSERTVYYHFLESVPTRWTSNNTGFTPFNENQRSFIKSAFDYFSTIIDLKFVETKTYDSFNTIVLGNNDQGGSGSAGYMTGAPGDEAWGMFISNVHPNATSLLNPQSSSWVPQIYIHELGHVLGLKHPFGNTLPVLSDAEDNFDLTVMTYGSRSPGIAAPQGIQLQPLDIAALQYLYGPSKIAANATTDNSYTLDASGRNFIWDGGGIDRLDASSADRRLVLDLEPLTQGYFGASPGSLISNNGQVTINRGTAIEDVSATRFDDIIFGNNLDNRFFPNGGIDSIDGRDGNDTVILPINSSESKLYREENALVIASPNGSIVRLKNVETVRYKDGDRNASDLVNSPSTVSVPFHSILNPPSGVQTDNFTITYNFNEAVSGLTPSDFSITNGEIKSISGSGKTYLVTVAPSAGVFGVMTLQLSAASVTALSGVANLTTPPQYFQIDTAPVKLLTDPGAATVTNSTIMLKFDAALSVRSGEVVVRAASGAEVERLSLSDTSRFTQKGDVLYLYLKTEISDGSILSVNIPTGSILDLNGNSISYTITTSPSQTVKTVGTDGADTKNLGVLSDTYDGLGGDDRIWGEEGNDTIYGGSGNDRLNGMQGDDKLFGGDGDDLLLGGTGDDYFDGGSGTDTVDYNASFGMLSKDATITKTDDGYTVQTASEGIDRLKNVETIKFADKLITLDNTHTSSTNNAPLFGSASQSVSTNEDATKTITVAATDADNDALTYTISTAASRGTTSINGGTITYTPAKDYNGTDSFVVSASDGKGGTATQTVNVSVAAVNDAPFVLSAQGTRGTVLIGNQTIAEDTQGIVPIAPFQDVEGDKLSYSVSVAPTSGTAEIVSGTSSSGTQVYILRYTPTANYNGNDKIVVTISDGKGGTATQTTNFTVTPVNDAPLFSATSQAVSATAGTAKTITLAATDVDGDTLTYTVAMPGKGTASISGSTLTYTPGATATGSDSFVVTASDGKGGTATQTINATVAVAAAARAFIVNTLPGWVGSVGGNGSIVGSNGFEDIKVLYGQIALDGSFNRGGDIVRVSGNADSYVIGRTSASSAYIEAGTTTKVTIPIGSTGMGIVYDDGVRKLSFSGGAYKIGSQTFSADPTKITSPTDGTVLPTGADLSTQAFASLLTAGLSGGTAPDLTITGKVRIAGTNGVDVIKVGSTGGDLTFDGSFNRGGDIIILNKAAGDYSAAKFSGSTIVISSGIEKLTIPMGSAGLTLRFTDGDRTLIFKNSAFNIGDQVISSATATPLTPSSITLSADQGITGNSVILDATGKVIFTDDATKTSNVILKNFGTDDVIRVTGATASQYNFAISALDPKDLEITYTDAVTSATNTIVLDDVIKDDAFIADYATASTALGWNFMAFG